MVWPGWSELPITKLHNGPNCASRDLADFGDRRHRAAGVGLDGLHPPCDVLGGLGRSLVDVVLAFPRTPPTALAMSPERLRGDRAAAAMNHAWVSQSPSSSRCAVPWLQPHRSVPASRRRTLSRFVSDRSLDRLISASAVQYARGMT